MTDDPIPTYPVAALMGARAPLIPVLSIENADTAEPLLEALVAGGIEVLEVTLRTQAALEVIRRMVAMGSSALVGAGTIIKPSQFAQVIEAGGRFGVSPALTQTLGEAAIASGLPFVPGVATPSEVLAAREFGFRELKMFPAEQVGGLSWVKHMAPLYPDTRFCPTAGITEGNAAEFLERPNIFAVGGAFLAAPELIAAGDWAGITERAKRIVGTIRG